MKIYVVVLKSFKETKPIAVKLRKSSAEDLVAEALIDDQDEKNYGRTYEIFEFEED